MSVNRRHAVALVVGLVVWGCGGRADIVPTQQPATLTVANVEALIHSLSPTMQQLGLIYQAAATTDKKLHPYLGGGDFQPGGPPDGVFGNTVPEGGDSPPPDPPQTPVSGYCGDAYGVWYEGIYTPDSFNYTLYSDAGLTQPVGAETYSSMPTTQGQDYPNQTIWTFDINSGPTAQQFSFNWLVDDPAGLNSNLATDFTDTDGSGYQLTIATVQGISSITELFTGSPGTPGPTGPSPDVVSSLSSQVVGQQPGKAVTIDFTEPRDLKGSIVVQADQSAKGLISDLGGAQLASMAWDSNGSATVTFKGGNTARFNVGDVLQGGTTRQGALAKSAHVSHGS